MGARARGALGGALAVVAAAGAALAVVTVAGLVSEGPGPGRAAAQPLGPVTLAGEQRAGPDGCCRWELATLVPFERHWEALEQGGAPAWATKAFPPVVLLDQCSGRTWTLEFRAGPGGHDWRLLRRQGID